MRSKHIILHSNSSQQHSAESVQRPPWKPKSRFRLFMYWYSSMRGMGGLVARYVNSPYQYQKLTGMNKKFTQISHIRSLHSYSVTMTVAARLGGSRSKIQARLECHFVRKPVTSTSQRQVFFLRKRFTGGGHDGSRGISHLSTHKKSALRSATEQQHRVQSGQLSPQDRVRLARSLCPETSRLVPDRHVQDPVRVDVKGTSTCGRPRVIARSSLKTYLDKNTRLIVNVRYERLSLPRGKRKCCVR